MEVIFTDQPILGAILIFVLRVGNMSLDTLRMMFMMRGKNSLYGF
jgi:hypothetical protein